MPLHSPACCSVLQCVAVCCSVLQCVAVCCSVLQCHCQVLFVCHCIHQRWQLPSQLQCHTQIVMTMAHRDGNYHLYCNVCRCVPMCAMCASHCNGTQRSLCNSMVILCVPLCVSMAHRDGVSMAHRDGNYHLNCNGTHRL